MASSRTRGTGIQGYRTRVHGTGVHDTRGSRGCSRGCSRGVLTSGANERCSRGCSRGVLTSGAHERCSRGCSRAGSHAGAHGGRAAEQQSYAARAPMDKLTRAGSPFPPHFPPAAFPSRRISLPPLFPPVAVPSRRVCLPSRLRPLAAPSRRTPLPPQFPPAARPRCSRPGRFGGILFVRLSERRRVRASTSGSRLPTSTPPDSRRASPPGSAP
jgi:hypothetical protein